jgi:hypothetical protein
MRRSASGARSAPLVVEIVADDIEEPLPPCALSLDPLGRIGKRLRLEAQPVRPPFDHACDNAGLLEQPQMARDRRLGDAKTPTRLPDGGGAAAEPVHDLASDRVGERGEGIVSYSTNYSVSLG